MPITTLRVIETRRWSLPDECRVWLCVQEMMNQARQDTSGIKLEVNERFVTLSFISYPQTKS